MSAFSPVRAMLLAASLGTDHLAKAGLLALESGDAELARDLFLAAFETGPLHPMPARMLLALGPELARLGPEQSRSVCAADRHSRDPAPEVAQAFAVADETARSELARRMLAVEPDNLLWTRLCLEAALGEGDFAEAARLARSEAVAQTGCAALLVQAEIALCREAWDEAGRLLSALPEGEQWIQSRLRLVPALAQAGRRERAAALARELAARHPWHAQALELAFDLARPVEDAAAPLSGEVAILLYTYNKARDLERTLCALARAELEGARVVVLDNGSSDHTLQVLAEAARRFPGDRFRFFSLPVNVGAPAARNWLARENEARQSDFCLFLDDDALVPANLLQRFGAAVRDYPDASAWGCRVVDAANPKKAQSVNLNLLPGEPEPGQSFSLCLAHLQEPSLGQHAFIAPCTSVTGCCHLLRTEELAGEPFDIRFSPSQYDDFERDLRLAERGGYCAYQGHLRVDHFQRTAAKATREPAARLAAANARKLHAVIGPETARTILDNQTRLLAADQAAKRASLGLDAS